MGTRSISDGHIGYRGHWLDADQRRKRTVALAVAVTVSERVLLPKPRRPTKTELWPALQVTFGEALVWLGGPAFAPLGEGRPGPQELTWYAQM